MRRINSEFRTVNMSEEGKQLSNRDYFGYAEMDDFACYVLADSLDAEFAVNSARLVVENIIRDFTEAPAEALHPPGACGIEQAEKWDALKSSCCGCSNGLSENSVCLCRKQQVLPDPQRQDTGADTGPVPDAEPVGCGEASDGSGGST